MKTIPGQIDAVPGEGQIPSTPDGGNVETSFRYHHGPAGQGREVESSDTNDEPRFVEILACGPGDDLEWVDWLIAAEAAGEVVQIGTTVDGIAVFKRYVDG